MIVSDMSNVTFKESSAAPVRDGDFWRAVLITPGKGSSAIYTEDVLRRDGATAFPAGTHSYVNHLQEGEVRSPEKLWGVLAEDAYYENGVGLVAKIKVMPHWADFVEAVAPHTGLSVFVEGMAARNDDGDLLVESFVPNTMNTVDLVSWPGRKGSGLASKLYESAVRASESDSGDTSGDTVSIIEEGNSDMELKELSDQIAEMPNLIAAAVAEALAPAVEPEEKEEVDVEAIAEALVAADLPEVSRKAVYESLRNGGELTVAIEAQKAFVSQVKEHLAESAKAETTRSEEALIVNTPEAAATAPTLSGLLNIKVGA
jgi:hypothetical protein